MEEGSRLTSTTMAEEEEEECKTETTTEITGGESEGEGVIGTIIGKEGLAQTENGIRTVFFSLPVKGRSVIPL